MLDTHPRPRIQLLHLTEKGNNMATRIRTRSQGFTESRDDVFVEQFINNEWIIKKAFNSNSDNYAMTNAKAYELQLQRGDHV